MSTTNPQSIKNRNYHLDFLRGLAALVVVADHLHQHFSIPLKDAHGLTRVLYLDHYFAGAAVMLFFMLSGYLVGTSVLTNVKNGRWSWSNYIVSRFSRLYVALIPALLWTLMLDVLAKKILLHTTIWFDSADRLRDFIGSAFFLQGILVKPFGTDGALWSLSYEFWFYILFPPIVLLVFRQKRLWINAMLLGAVAVLVGWPILRLFPCWLGGVGMGMTAEKWPTLSRRMAAWVTLGTIPLLIATMCAEGLHILPFLSTGGLPVDFYVDALVVAPMLWVGLKAPSAQSEVYKRTAVFFSEMSYTLYLTHEPFLCFLRSVWLKNRPWPSDGKHVLMMVLPYAMTVLAGYGIYLLFESKTDQVRAFLKFRLLVNQRSMPGHPLPVGLRDGDGV